MVFVPDLVSILNAVLCLIIVVLGTLVYVRKSAMGALLIGIAFGLFGLSHVYILLGLSAIWEIALITARICGYILVIAALCLFLKNGMEGTEN
jgi:hypothetical protein